MFVAWVIFHVIVCIALVLVVLMQSSKGEGLAGSAFSSGISGAVFGGRGAATFLSKATTILAIVFFLNCGALAYMSSQARVGGSAGETATESAVTRQAQKAMEEQIQRQQQSQPTDTTQPAAPTATPTPIDTTK